jgi:selenide, water dikinase
MNTTVPPAPIRLTAYARGGAGGRRVPPGALAELLEGSLRMPVPPQLLVGLGTGDDAAVYRLGDTQALVATTAFFPPMVDDPFDFGRIAATHAISGVQAMGGMPIMALALVGMPIDTLPLEAVARILAGGESACAAAGIPVAGGHTIDAAEPLYGLVVLGLVHPDRVARNAGAHAGDLLVLGKPIGVGVLSAALERQVLTPQGYAAMLASATQLNTSGRALADLAGVHALTDVGGGGLLGHTLGLARGARLRARLDMSAVPLLDGVRELASRGVRSGASAIDWAASGHEVRLGEGVGELECTLLTDPQIGGGLLVACAPDSLEAVLEIFRRDGFARAAVVGALSDGEPEVEVCA